MRPTHTPACRCRSIHDSRLGALPYLQVGSELEPTHTSTGRLVYKKVEIDDAEGEDLVVHLPACLEFIDEGRKAGTEQRIRVMDVTEEPAHTHTVAALFLSSSIRAITSAMHHKFPWGRKRSRAAILVLLRH